MHMDKMWGQESQYPSVLWKEMPTAMEFNCMLLYQKDKPDTLKM